MQISSDIYVFIILDVFRKVTMIMYLFSLDSNQYQFEKYGDSVNRIY